MYPKTGNPKCFLRKDVHEVQNSGSANFKYDTDSVEFKHIQFATNMFEFSPGSQNSQNIMFDEISTLHHALTDLHLENKVRVPSKTRFKMDTGASGNLLSISTYCKLFPNHTMKDLVITIDPIVKLITATNSSIKQICTVYL